MMSKKALISIGAVVGFVSTIVLVFMNNINGATLILLSTIAFALILEIDRLELLQILGLKAKLTKSIDNAEQATRIAVEAYKQCVAASIHLLGFSGRFSSNQSSQKTYDLAREIIESVDEGLLTDQIEQSIADFKKIILWDYILAIKTVARRINIQSELHNKLSLLSAFDDFPSPDEMEQLAAASEMLNEVQPELDSYRQAITLDLPPLCER